MRYLEPGNHMTQARLLFAILIALCSIFLGRAARGANVSGEWEFTGKFLNDVSYARLNLSLDGQKISGKLYDLSLEGTLDGNEFSFAAKQPSGKAFGDFKGSVQADKLEGTAVWFGDQNISWSAKRPQTPPASPQVHTFEPKEFHRVFSEGIAPVLHIFPGDTVKTWTWDPLESTCRHASLSIL